MFRLGCVKEALVASAIKFKEQTSFNSSDAYIHLIDGVRKKLSTVKNTYGITPPFGQLYPVECLRELTTFAPDFLSVFLRYKDAI